MLRNIMRPRFKKSMARSQEIIADLCRLRSTKRVNLDSFSERGGGGGGQL